MMTVAFEREGHILVPLLDANSARRKDVPSTSVCDPLATSACIDELSPCLCAWPRGSQRVGIRPGSVWRERSLERRGSTDIEP